MSGPFNRLLAVSCAALPAVGLSLIACSAPATSSRTAEPASRFVTRPPELWGDLKPVVSVKELMRDMLDPASDFIFDAVKVEYTRKGVVETFPRTDKDWEKIRFGAVTLAEGAYLMKIPRPFAPAGDENNSIGPDAPELSPAQIMAKLEKDPVLWNAKIEALRNVSLAVLDIVKTRKVDDLWDAGYNLDQACESCHLEYWYPGDKALLEKLDRRIQQQFEQSSKPGAKAAPKTPGR